MKIISKTTIEKTERPIKFIQFGEGNFLRAFVDWLIQKGNESGIINWGGVIIQPLPHGMIDILNTQDCMYHVILEGVKDGKPIREIQLNECIMDAVNPYNNYEKYIEYCLLPDVEFVFSNTTEAGIVKVEGEKIDLSDHLSTSSTYYARNTPPSSFPGKVLDLLHKRYKKFAGAKDKGLNFICCELIENNSSTLKSIVIELANENGIDENFVKWIDHSCTFSDSLVDRIVSGFPKDQINNIQNELNYKDQLVVSAEYFHLWAIEGHERVKKKFPIANAGLNILWVEDLPSFRNKKVRVLNGAHTALVPLGLQAGYSTVKEAYGNDKIHNFIERMVSEEILPTINGDIEELEDFARTIQERFQNPYLEHFMKDIALNSISKWMTRNYPSLLDNLKMNAKLPKRLTFSLAALLQLYSKENTIGFKANDSCPQLNTLINVSYVNCSESELLDILKNTKIWGEDLSKHEELAESLFSMIKLILQNGIIGALKELEK